MIGQMRGAGNVVGRAHGGGHGGAGARVVEARHQHGRFGLRLGQDFHGDVGHRAQRAPGAGEQFAQVVAGDVLDHAAARLDGVAAAGHRGDAQKVVARGARLDAARAGEIGGDHAADGALPRRLAEQRAVIHRLEAELLVVFRKQRLDLGERRAGARRQHQFFRLVERDAGEA